MGCNGWPTSVGATCNFRSFIGTRLRESSKMCSNNPYAIFFENLVGEKEEESKLYMYSK